MTFRRLIKSNNYLIFIKNNSLTPCPHGDTLQINRLRRPKPLGPSCPRHPRHRRRHPYPSRGLRLRRRGQPHRIPFRLLICDSTRVSTNPCAYMFQSDNEHIFRSVKSKLLLGISHRVQPRWGPNGSATPKSRV